MSLKYVCDLFMRHDEGRDPTKCSRAAAFEDLDNGVLVCKDCAALVINGQGKEILVHGPHFGRQFQDQLKKDWEMGQRLAKEGKLN